MLSKEDLKGWDEIDAIAQRVGGYVAKRTGPLIIEFDYPAMTKYCKEKNISKMDLTEDELKMFEYPEPLVYA